MTVTGGIRRAMKDAKSEFGLSSFLILGILRHLSEEEGIKTLEEALKHRGDDGKLLIEAIGLDSSEQSNPPAKFTTLYQRAREAGLHLVAHAGEEGPPENIWSAINDLHVSRIDHGIACVKDKALLAYLSEKRIPLTVCPLSNIKLCVFSDMKQHVLPQMLREQLCVTINSDDPSYFGGYIADNFVAIQKAFNLSREVIVQLCHNSIEASFLENEQKRSLYDELEQFVEQFPH